jgi:hypothetical protein
MSGRDLVDAASRAVNDAANLQVRALTDLLRSDAWRQYESHTGGIVCHDSFAEYLTSRWGLRIDDPAPWLNTLAKHTNTPAAAHYIEQAYRAGADQEPASVPAAVEAADRALVQLDRVLRRIDTLSSCDEIAVVGVRRAALAVERSRKRLRARRIGA